MIPRKPLSLAVHAATFALVGAGYSAGAFAQDDEEAAVEEVVVTGSRIQRAV